MKFRMLAVCVLSMLPVVSNAALIEVVFEPEVADLPHLFQITDEFIDQGILFSTDASDLEGDFLSLETQENMIQSGMMTNMFRVDFVTDMPVISATVTFRDYNTNPQMHSLFAFDALGFRVDMDSFFDEGFFEDTFSLTVIFDQGISSLLAYEQPFGAQQLVSITYETVEVSEPETFLLMLSALMFIGFRNIKKKS